MTEMQAFIGLGALCSLVGGCFFYLGLHYGQIKVRKEIHDLTSLKFLG